MEPMEAFRRSFVTEGLVCGDDVVAADDGLVLDTEDPLSERCRRSP